MAANRGRNNADDICDAKLKFALILEFFGHISTCQTLTQHKLAIYCIQSYIEMFHIGSFNHSCIISDVSLSISALFENTSGSVVIGSHH